MFLIDADVCKSEGLPWTTTALAIVDSNLDPLSLCVIVTAV